MKAISSNFLLLVYYVGLLSLFVLGLFFNSKINTIVVQSNGEFTFLFQLIYIFLISFLIGIYIKAPQLLRMKRAKERITFNWTRFGIVSVLFLLIGVTPLITFYTSFDLLANVFSFSDVTYTLSAFIFGLTYIDCYQPASD